MKQVINNQGENRHLFINKSLFKILLGLLAQDLAQFHKNNKHDTSSQKGGFPWDQYQVL